MDPISCRLDPLWTKVAFLLNAGVSLVIIPSTIECRGCLHSVLSVGIVSHQRWLRTGGERQRGSQSMTPFSPRDSQKA